MDDNRKFGVWELGLIGVTSGIVVSAVKAVQAGFYLGDVPGVEITGAVLTYIAYVLFGVVGAIFFVDHDHTGQKMLKSAFFVGLAAPSFFLAFLSYPLNPNVGDFRQMLRAVPRISDLVISPAHAQQDNSKLDAFSKANEKVEILVLTKNDVSLSLTDALWKAFGWRVVPDSYTYLVGTTSDKEKALATAGSVNKILREYKGNVYATVLKPKGKDDFYVAIGQLVTPVKAVDVAQTAKNAAISELGAQAPSEEAKRAATLMLKGQVVDARAMFSRKD